MIERLAGDPAIVGHPGNGSKTHSRHAKDDIKDRRDSSNTCDACYILRKVFCAFRTIHDRRLTGVGDGFDCLGFLDCDGSRAC